MDDIAVATLKKNSRESIRIAIREFKGGRFVDVRLYVSNGAEEVPTGKGISIRPELLRPAIEALEEAERISEEKGLFR